MVNEMMENWIVKWVQQYPGYEPCGITTYTYVPKGWGEKQMREHAMQTYSHCIEVRWARPSTEEQVLNDDSWNVPKDTEAKRLQET